MYLGRARRLAIALLFFSLVFALAFARRADACDFMTNVSVGTGLGSSSSSNFGPNAFGTLDASVPLSTRFRVGGVFWSWKALRESEGPVERSDTFTGIGPMLELSDCSQNAEITIRASAGMAIGTSLGTRRTWGDFFQLSGGPRFGFGHVRLAFRFGVALFGGPADRFPTMPFFAIESGFAS